MSGEVGPNNPLEPPDSHGLIGDGHLPPEDDLLADPPDDLVIEQKNFRIRLADTENGRNKASMLINKMYAWRGYGNGHQVKANPSRITLTANMRSKPKSPRRAAIQTQPIPPAPRGRTSS